MKRLAVIPARGGSKRIPNKNIKDFCGKPIIAHSIGEAEASNLFDTIHVSTDSDKIAEIAAGCGHKPDFLRPQSLSDDYCPMLETVKFVVFEYAKIGLVFDTVALLYATSPLIDREDLKSACSLFEQSNKKKPLLSVSAFPTPIEHAFHLTEEGKLVPFKKEALSKRTQDLKQAYYDAGMFAFYSPEYIKNSIQAGDFMDYMGFEVASYKVTDIDWPEDWKRAEALYKAASTMKKQK